MDGMLSMQTHKQSLSSASLSRGPNKSSSCQTTRSSRKKCSSASSLLPVQDRRGSQQAKTGAISSRQPGHATAIPGIYYIKYPSTPDLSSSSCSSAREGLDGYTIGGSESADLESRMTEQASIGSCTSSCVEEQTLRSPEGGSSSDLRVQNRVEAKGLLSEDSCILGDGDEVGRGARDDRRQGSDTIIMTTTTSSINTYRVGELNKDDYLGAENFQHRSPEPSEGSSFETRVTNEPFQNRHDEARNLPQQLSTAKRESMSMDAGRHCQSGTTLQQTRKKNRRSAGRAGTACAHPLLSKFVPTLPGVDEHQRPPFYLGQMHENMRQIR